MCLLFCTAVRESVASVLAERLWSTPLYFDSDTTVHEVISSLLKKFKIVDDPRKFALYERFTEHGETTKGT